jgi:hypothetical protein
LAPFSAWPSKTQTPTNAPDKGSSASGSEVLVQAARSRTIPVSKASDPRVFMTNPFAFGSIDFIIFAW